MLAVVLMLLVVETATLHLLLVRYVPAVAYALSVLSLTAIVWLLADYRAMGHEALRLDTAYLHMHVGNRVDAVIDTAEIESVIRPTWLDLRAEAPAFLNATKPATPNVLLIFHEPLRIRVAGLRSRLVTRLALHLDDPEGFLSAWSLVRGSDAGNAAGDAG